MTKLDRTQLRIGDDEREAALDALTTHSREGRLTIDEYGERAEALQEARTQADILALFKDLPEPRPTLAPTTPDTSLTPAAGRPATPETRRGPLGLPDRTDRPTRATDRFAGTLLGVPVGAVAAAGVSYATGSWLFMFLAPPIAYAADRLSRRGRKG
ncbi:DUF1707 domain-containing protein [Streptomyces mobaraensis]|uniref:DUF1707 domain-containing protein n=1 Tax=Streptomyces mobaraensis TaxID=35621 RepID=A0A5N5VZN5_STRMB|nr:DUF1707 domain-containing protein [Streptomyces mobaraensis]KAB7834284.1 DUF1707 domain-containing protein [Streptomyces mobaraensis]